MKTKPFLPKIILLSIFSFLFCASIFSQWTNLTPSTNFSFKDISFSSQSIGFAIIDSSSISSLYKTQNAGTTWQNLNLNFSPITGVVIQSVYFVDDNTGYIQFRGNDSGLKSYVYKTVNGGLNWVDKTPTNLSVGYGVSDVFFTDVNTGFVGIGDVICKTIDGGNNWTTTTLTPYNSPNEIDFYDANNGILGAWDGTFAYKGIIYTTTNGGVSWDSLDLNSNYTFITDVDYTNNNTAYALTDDAWTETQKIYKTIDNAQTWDTLFLGFLLDSLDAANDMHFINDTLGYLSTEKGYIFITNDGGLNWSQEHFETPYLDIIAYNGSNIFVGGPLSTLVTKSLSTALKESSLRFENKMYPNPVNRSGIVYFEKPIFGLLQITDLSGRLIKEEQLKNESTFNLSSTNISPGIYMLTLIGNEVSSQKLIVR